VSKRRGPTPRRHWQPLQAATPIISAEAQALRIQLDVDPGDEVWLNDRYVVHVTFHRDRRGAPIRGVVRELSIRRQDRKAVNDWRDAMRIKNQLAGEHIEAVELYPAQDRVVDTANQRYLWCYPPGHGPTWDGETPIGFPVGARIDPGEGPAVGAVQRPFDPSDPERESWDTAVARLTAKGARAQEENR
jgi:hypothetical protein